ncbi:protein of unknown function [Legionella fallonii LLAP-10]|uniref:Uncharacterized protein n=1 Tax=Legionella fallonii LLAP-10 TaxID=1212491 RepID=A0A098G4Y6_9GAMM|nr:protein of unknown function [Legionella fallonii LLAP-10]
MPQCLNKAQLLVFDYTEVFNNR